MKENKLFRITRLGLAVLLGLSMRTLGHALPQDCAGWDQKFGLLPREQRTLLTQYKVVSFRGFFLISPELISDCTLRGAVAGYIEKGLQNHLGKTDRVFAKEHRSLINSSVIHIWPLIAESPAVPADGSLYDDKWSLLLDDVLEDSTVTALVSRNIQKHGLWTAATYVLMRRSLPNLAIQLHAILNSPDSTVTERLCAIAVLSHFSIPDPLSLLQQSTAGYQLTQGEQETIRRLHQRFSRGLPAEWSDIEKLVEEDT